MSCTADGGCPVYPYAGPPHTIASNVTTAAADPRLGFRLGDWQVRPTAGELVRDGEVHHIEPKVMDVLVELARAYPDVLERDDVIRAVWNDRPTSDDALARCVTILRKEFGDTPTQPRFIQTVPKRGYRLLIPIEPAATGDRAPAAEAASSTTVEGWTGPLEFDQLKITRLLGRGSMGLVHLAQETNLERLVAVKTLRGIIVGDERAERRFRREASAAARIDHPNVASVYRLGDLPNGSPYIVMQYVRGRTLTSLMASSNGIMRDAARSIIGQISQALAAAHREHIIHRDVKPGNVMIEEDSNLAILTDFGIAGLQETGSRIATQLTMHGEVLGDARYISPEQATGEPPSPASDIYSLGIIAYELLAGVYPYAENVGGVQPHLHSQARPLSEVVADIDPAIEKIVMQALAKQPDERPTANQFTAAMDPTTTAGDAAMVTSASRGWPKTATWLLVSAAVVASAAVYLATR